jgi:hypothetical protein
MTLLTNEQREQLLENGRAQRDAEKRGEPIDFYPVVKLFTPEAQATWLLTELHPRDPDVAFGLWASVSPSLDRSVSRSSSTPAVRGDYRR